VCALASVIEAPIGVSHGDSNNFSDDCMDWTDLTISIQAEASSRTRLVRLYSVHMWNMDVMTH
jgi:hypothetical protein